MNQKPKHREPSTNSYAATYGHEFGFVSRELKAIRKDWLRRTCVSCGSGGIIQMRNLLFLLCPVLRTVLMIFQI